MFRLHLQTAWGSRCLHESGIADAPPGPLSERLYSAATGGASFASDVMGGKMEGEMEGEMEEPDACTIVTS